MRFVYEIVCVERKRGYEVSKPYWEIQFKLVKCVLMFILLVSNGSKLVDSLGPATNQLPGGF